MEAVLLIIRLALFGIFALAGIGKLLDLKGAEKAVIAFGTPKEFARTFAIAIPFAELVFAFCFLFNETSWIGAIGGLILLLSFIGGMAWQIRLGNAPDCHCFGQIHSEPVGIRSLVRNIIFAALTLVLIFRGPENQGLTLAGTSGQIALVVSLIVIVTVLVVMAAYIKRLADQNRDLVRRFELLELFANDGKPVERNEAGDPTDSLPIGAQFPDFALQNLKGRIVTIEHLLSDPLPKLFLFVGPSCEPCKALLPELEKWREEFAAKIRFVYVSSGSANENAEVFGEEIGKLMLLQKHRELADSVYAKWTPAAIFVASDGTIAGHPAVGDLTIHDLIDSLRGGDIADKNFYFAKSGKRSRIKIGKAVPHFSLNDLNGNAVTDEFFKGSDTLAVFLSTTCSFCSDVVKEIRDWELSPNGHTRIIVFSEGDRGLHVDFGLKSPIIIEKNYVTALKIGMYGVPSAVLVDKSGTIVSEAAVGSRSIWSLLGKYD